MAEDISFKINAQGADAAARSLTNISKSAEVLDGSMGKLSIASNALRNAFAPLLGVWAGVATIQNTISFINKANDAFVESLQATKDATQEQRDYADALQNTLGINDRVTLGLEDQAAAMGISTTHVQDAAVAAIGLSNITGGDLESSLMKVNQVLRGNADALGKVIPGLKDLTTEEAKLAAISALVNRGLEEQREDMEGVYGAQTRATNSVEDLMESFGALLAPMRAVVSDGVYVFAESLHNVLEPAVGAAIAIMDHAPAAAKVMASGIVGAVTGVEVVIGNLPALIGSAFNRIELVWIGFTENFRHSLTVAMPQYAMWFATNWHKLIVDTFTASDAIVKNFSYNFAQTMLALFSWLEGGMEEGIEKVFAKMILKANRGLLDGFEASIGPLPEIIARKLTERERDLRGQIGNFGRNIGKEFADKFAERMGIVNEAFSSTAKKVNLTQDKLAMAAIGEVKVKNDAELKAVESRILTRGRADDPAVRTADTVKVVADVLKEMNDRDEREANKPPPEPIRLEVASA